MKKRVSKFELIRIIAMYLIVLHHSMVHGMLTMKPGQVLEYPWKSAVGYILASGGKIGVYLFILITGYFMINSTISIKKLVKLWLPIFFWSVLLFVIFGCIINHEFSVKNLIKSIFPIIFNRYWFMTVYVVMYMLIPILNNSVDWIVNNKREKYFALISLVIIIGNKLLGGSSQVGSLLATFCIVYCAGAIFRRENILDNHKISKLSKVLFPIVTFVNFLLIALFVFAYNYKQISVFYTVLKSLLLDPYTLFSILEALLLFIIIGNSKIKYHKFLNATASVTFGIYIISENIYVRNLFWKRIFHMGNLINDNIFMIIIFALAISGIVFIVCGILEELRKLLFNSLENILSNKVENIFKNKF